MKYIRLICLILMLSGCKTIMTVLPGQPEHLDKDGEKVPATLATIIMDGNGVGSVKLPDGTEASMDTKSSVNILNQISPIVSDVSRAAMTKEMLKN